MVLELMLTIWPHYLLCDDDNNNYDDDDSRTLLRFTWLGLSTSLLASGSQRDLAKYANTARPAMQQRS